MYSWSDINPVVGIVEVIQDKIVGVKTIGLELIYKDSLLTRVYAIDDPQPLYKVSEVFSVVQRHTPHKDITVFSHHGNSYHSMMVSASENTLKAGWNTTISSYAYTDVAWLARPLKLTALWIASLDYGLGLILATAGELPKCGVHVASKNDTGQSPAPPRVLLLLLKTQFLMNT